jgi:hypothetical protein
MDWIKSAGRATSLRLVVTRSSCGIENRSSPASPVIWRWNTASSRLRSTSASRFASDTEKNGVSRPRIHSHSQPCSGLKLWTHS